MNSRATRITAMLVLGAAATLLVAQNDVVHPITVARHRATAFTDAEAAGKLNQATTLLRTRDRNTDVPCAVTLQLSGTLDSFGAGTDRLDIIDSEAELQQVMRINSHRIKVVTSIQAPIGQRVCDVTGAASLLGCAQTPGISMVMALRAPADVWAHEFGHNKSLAHRNDPNRKNIMHATAPRTDEVNAGECTSYRR
jgi:hypothetical protein